VERWAELNLAVRKLAAAFMMVLEENRRETSRIINTGVRFLMAYAIRRWMRHINWELGGEQEERRTEGSEEELGLKRQER
jgi:hypothetical protein